MMERSDIQKRSSWVIIDIIQRNQLSNVTLGEIMGCGKNTINNYRHAITTPGTEFISRLSDYYGVNVEWLHMGVGEPYHGDGLGPRAPLGPDDEMPVAYPLPGSIRPSSSAPENVHDHSLEQPWCNEGRGFRMSSVLGKASRILSSKTPYGRILFQNIDYYYNAVMLEMKNIEMQHELGQLRRQVNALKREIETIKEKRRKNTPAPKKRNTGRAGKSAAAKKPKTRKAGKSRAAKKPPGRKAKKTGASEKPKARKANKAGRPKRRKVIKA